MSFYYCLSLTNSDPYMTTLMPSDSLSFCPKVVVSYLSVSKCPPHSYVFRESLISSSRGVLSCIYFEAVHEYHACLCLIHTRICIVIGSTPKGTSNSAYHMHYRKNIWMIDFYPCRLYILRQGNLHVSLCYTSYIWETMVYNLCR